MLRLTSGGLSTIIPHSCLGESAGSDEPLHAFVQLTVRCHYGAESDGYITVEFVPTFGLAEGVVRRRTRTAGGDLRDLPARHRKPGDRSGQRWGVGQRDHEDGQDDRVAAQADRFQQNIFRDMRTGCRGQAIGWRHAPAASEPLARWTFSPERPESTSALLIISLFGSDWCS